MIYSMYPKEESEKAISNYTKQLIKAQRNQGIEVNNLLYTAGNSSTLNLNKIKDGDVVHIQHEYNLLGKFGIPFFKVYNNLGNKKVKVITTMHNVLSQSQEFSGSFLKTFLRKKLYKYQNSTINKNSDIIIVHAEFFKKILVEEYNIPKEKVIVLRQGIQENIKLIPKNQAKEELNLSGNVYLIIGSLIPDHGADTIIKQACDIDGTILIVANNKAVNDRNDSRIKDWLEYNRKLAIEELSTNVRFDIKDLPYSLWWKYFSAADVVLLPYKGGIGSGIFADCIATKKPMVTSNIKYFREFARDWKFINIAETMKICGNNFSTRCSYAEAIEEIQQIDKSELDNEFNEYIKEYGMTALAKKYKEIYKN